ncbi:aminopeptidase N [Streptomyces sp. A3M-1-3]|uniref:aminopeptidase N n=1 Tax=Streptomyces sp. A3M-1-3 TaxID=2962044 RepID=UPI0020B8FF61|nr:aminopeptidase N [Streptomyces sp. A3M-1-3]MCP3817752.1 aminopeptidase N [Streptomyces sp. A3M-1-3]
MPGTNLTRDEAQQRARLLTVDSYEIDLDLSGAQEGGTYRSVTTVRFASAEAGAETFIDLVAPAVHEVVLNGKSLDVAAIFRDSRIALRHLAAGPNELKVVADCAYTNTGEGLHRFVDPVDQQAYLYTQFEVPDARRVFASFEQPDLKATFQFTVKAPAGWTVISNSPLQHSDGAEPGDSVWRFEPTPRISSYITALIVGPYHSVHSSYEKDGQSVPLGIYCRPSLAEFLDADAIFEVTRQGFDWFQEKFDYAYPFAKYDQLFVPEFNAGAMENAGAVTIRDQYVFRSKVTDAAYERRAETILHELAHMWFGDLVTMEWWNDLWLNESFATYTSVACQAYAEGSKWPNAWTTFANSEKTWAYRQDQLPSTHPIMADIRDLDDVLVNFDGITYAKGASVLKQLVAYVGQDEFFRGVQAYFKAHAFGNTRLSDLLGALEETSGRDLTSWSKAWLETAGINVLRPELETAEDGTLTSFAVKQEAPALPKGAKGEPTLRPHRIAIGLYDLEDGKLVRTDRIELDVDGELTAVPELVGRRRPAVVLLNDDDLSYAKVRLDAESLAMVTEHLGDFTESLPRALCWASAWDMTRDGELATRDYLSLVLSGIAKESDIGVVQSLHRQVKLAIDLYAAPDWREAGLAQWTEAALTHLRAAEPGSDHQLAWARAFAAAARTPQQLDLLTGLLEGKETIEGLAVDTELRWAFVERLAATGVFDEQEITAEYERDRTAAGERHAATARAARPTAEAKAAAWASVVASDKLPNAVQEAVIGGFVQTDQRELLAPYVGEFFAAVKGVWESRSHEMAQQIAVGLYPSLQVSQATLDVTDAWLASAEPNAALRRLVSESRAGVERALKAQAADAAAG